MMKTETYQQPDLQGYYGDFGGAYIPEMLHRNVAELKLKYLEIMQEDSFQEEFQQLFLNFNLKMEEIKQNKKNIYIKLKKLKKLI